MKLTTACCNVKIRTITRKKTLNMRQLKTFHVRINHWIISYRCGSNRNKRVPRASLHSSHKATHRLTYTLDPISSWSPALPTLGRTEVAVIGTRRTSLPATVTVTHPNVGRARRKTTFTRPTVGPT